MDPGSGEKRFGFPAHAAVPERTAALMLFIPVVREVYRLLAADDSLAYGHDPAICIDLLYARRGSGSSPYCDCPSGRSPRDASVADWRGWPSHNRLGCRDRYLTTAHQRFIN
jgi:hypothetical protein